MRNFKISTAQERHTKCHPDADEIANYRIQDLPAGEFLVTNLVDNIAYLVSPNPLVLCDPDNCLIKCTTCRPNPPCSHAFICRCKGFARRNYCRHTHLVSSLVTEKPDKERAILKIYFKMALFFLWHLFFNSRL